jgi:uncharacterized paraquat-inducible protein A
MLIKCPECKNEVSDKAASCPKCGIPLTVKDNKKNSIEKKEYDFFKMATYFFVPFLFIFIGTYERAGANALPNAIFGGFIFLAILSAIFGNKKK